MNKSLANRHTGMELLRIISMLFVLCLHFFIKGGYLHSKNNLVYNESWFLFCFSIVAVNCYVLITGYFMSEKSFILSRVTLVYSQMWFYSVLLFSVTVLFGITKFTTSSVANAVLPLTFGHYWFILNYLLLLLLSPLLNTAIQKMNQKKYKCVLFVLISVFSVANFLLKPINPVFDSSGGFGLVWFCILYLTSAYLRKYGYPNRKMVYSLIYVACCIVSFVIHIFTFGKGEVWEISMVRDYNNPIIYLASIAVFVVFLNISINNRVIKRLILFVSPLTLAVYLIHESSFVSGWLWNTINVNTWCVNNGLFIIQALGTVFAIFILCCAFEFIRKTVFKLLKIDYLVIKLSDYAESKIRGIIVK